MEVEVRAALEKFRRGDDETAFFELIEMPGDVLTGIIDVFHAEPRADIRAFLVKAAWERREETVMPFLAEALNNNAEEVWQASSRWFGGVFFASVAENSAIGPFA